MAQRQITHAVNGRVHTFTFTGQAPVVFDEARASAENNDHARTHGWKQRLADAAALDKGATPAEKRAATAELAEYYMGGEVAWARKGGGGARPFDVGLVVQAMCNVLTNGDVGRANLAIDKLAARDNIGRDAAAKMFATDEKVAVEMGRIRAARVSVKFDAAAALDEFTAEPVGETTGEQETEETDQLA